MFKTFKKIKIVLHFFLLSSDQGKLPGIRASFAQGPGKNRAEPEKFLKSKLRGIIRNMPEEPAPPR